MRHFKPYTPENVPNMPTIDPKRPLDVEIGCGVGLHPIIHCKEKPERQLIAIEHTRDKFLKFQRRAMRHELENLFPVHANAISFLSHHKLNSSVDTIFLLYPNPNPKKGHLNKRWHAMPFMSYLWKTLKPQGKLVLATNEEWYFLEALEYFRSIWNFPVQETFTFSGESHPNFQPRTHFEKKYLLNGETCHQITLKKSDSGTRTQL